MERRTLPPRAKKASKKAKTKDGQGKPGPPPAETERCPSLKAWAAGRQCRKALSPAVLVKVEPLRAQRGQAVGSASEQRSRVGANPRPENPTSRLPTVSLVAQEGRPRLLLNDPRHVLSQRGCKAACARRWMAATLTRAFGTKELASTYSGIFDPSA